MAGLPLLRVVQRIRPLFCRPCALLYFTDPGKQYSDSSYQQRLTDGSINKLRVAAGLLMGTGIGMGVWYLKKTNEAGVIASGPAAIESPRTAQSLEPVTAADDVGQFQHGLPTYTSEDVSKHDSVEKGVWVTFRHGVYDITKFLPQHPGADKVLMAAGGSVEPFWALYAIHKEPHVLKLLEQYRIGNLTEEDVGTHIANVADHFANEPRRHPALRTNSKKPYNAELPLELLAENFITPNELFYVRNHLPVPSVDANSYELEIGGEEVKEMTLKLDDIKKFPKYTVISTVQCAGNRRSEMAQVKQVKGLNWGQAAIGNATWSGARLYDVLRAAGLTERKCQNVEHVEFEGLDTDPANMPYGASIPIEKAMNPHGDVLLAYEMNGEALPRDHGFPLRVIVPGVVGARNVKWLGRINVSKKESDSHWQQNDYKGFSPSTDWDTVDYRKSPAIQELPVNSAICSPKEGNSVLLKDGRLEVSGYAWSGGGCKIVRVDVTADGGKTWHIANLVHQDSARPPRHWSWTLWKADIPLLEGSSNAEIWVKAVDSSYNVQPEKFENIWNFRGLLSNAYHRVRVKISDKRQG